MATVKQKGTIYCTKEQFDTLMSTGSVVIGGVTYTYEDGWQYAVIDKDYVSGVYKHNIKLSDESSNIISFVAYSTSNTPVTSNSTLQEILLVNSSENEYYTGIFAGNDAPRPCAIELSYTSSTVGIRYGLDGQNMTTFSISTYNDIVTAI